MLVLVSFMLDTHNLHGINFFFAVLQRHVSSMGLKQGKPLDSFLDIALQDPSRLFSLEAGTEVVFSISKRQTNIGNIIQCVPHFCSHQEIHCRGRWHHVVLFMSNEPFIVAGASALGFGLSGAIVALYALYAGLCCGLPGLVYTDLQRYDDIQMYILDV